MTAPARGTGFLDRARSLMASGAYAEAIPLLSTAARQEPRHAHTHFLLGICYLRTNDPANAEQCFRRVVALDHGSHDGHYYLGLALERQGKHRDALLEYRFALTIKPDFREAAARINAIAPGSEVARGPTPPEPVPHPTRPEIASNPVPSGGAGPGAGAGAGSLAEELAARKGRPADETDEAMAGEPVIAGYRRMRSFSGHFILILAVLAVWGLMLLLLVAAEHSGPTEQLVFTLTTLALLFLLVTLFWRSRAHHYTIFERRIDIQTGLLFRKSASVWIYQIEQTWITRSPLNVLTGDSTLHLRVQAAPGVPAEVCQLAGLGNYRQMEELWTRLRDRTVVERREMKSVWI